MKISNFNVRYSLHNLVSFMFLHHNPQLKSIHMLNFSVQWSLEWHDCGDLDHTGTKNESENL